MLYCNADHVFKTIDALPINAHPMTQFATGVMALQVLTSYYKLSSCSSTYKLIGFHAVVCYCYHVYNFK